MLGAAASAILASLFLWRWLSLPSPARPPSSASLSSAEAPSASSLSGALASSPSVAREPAQTYRLEVASTPSDAEVYGNGVLLGHTPLVTTVAAGSGTLHLELRAAGFEPYARDLEATRDVQLVAQLAPARQRSAPDATPPRPRSLSAPAAPKAHAPASTAMPPPSASAGRSAPAPSWAPAAPPVVTAPSATPPKPIVDPLGQRQ
jgi:hypothetical protein